MLAWLRGGPEDPLLAAVNFTSEAVALRLGDVLPARAALLLSTDPDRASGEVEPAGLVLGPAEGVLLRP